MALIHKFSIMCQNNVLCEKDIVNLPDNLLRYLGDSLQWINTNWNGKEVKPGISYYGFSIIESVEIEKLLKIIEQWKCLFELAPSSFYIKGEFMPDEAKYEKLLLNKSEIIQIFNSWIELCKKAIEKDFKILYEGI